MKRGISVPDNVFRELDTAATESGLSFSSLVRMMLMDSVSQGRLRAVLKAHAEVLRAEMRINEIFARRALMNRARAIRAAARTPSRDSEPLRYEDAMQALKDCATIARNKGWTREHRELLKLRREFEIRAPAARRPRWREPAMENLTGGSWRATCGWCSSVSTGPLEPVKCGGCGIRFRPPETKKPKSIYTS